MAEVDKTHLIGLTADDVFQLVKMGVEVYNLARRAGYDGQVQVVSDYANVFGTFEEEQAVFRLCEQLPTPARWHPLAIAACRSVVQTSSKLISSKDAQC